MLLPRTLYTSRLHRCLLFIPLLSIFVLSLWLFSLSDLKINYMWQSMCAAFGRKEPHFQWETLELIVKLTEKIIVKGVVESWCSWCTLLRMSSEWAEWLNVFTERYGIFRGHVPSYSCVSCHRQADLDHTYLIKGNLTPMWLSETDGLKRLWVRWLSGFFSLELCCWFQSYRSPGVWELLESQQK